ncbi:MAG: copper chaperone PCu(A)C [Gammaproteobacteria bacterium]|nr:copper chaperone PCu(A)C [Gammaproteobacteria bacterium]MBS9781356.1 copper chaperone PCu(A)C [Gammaproteobacteria bacterium]
MQKKSIVLLITILLCIGAYGLVKQDKKIKTDSKTDKGLSVPEEIPKKQEKTTQAKIPVPLNYWVHFDPKTASKSLSAYGEFFNVNTDKALYLTSVENKDFARVELHTIKDGKDMIASTDSLLLPAMGGSVKFEYGGNYIVLVAPKKPITDGSETTLTLHYRVQGSDEKLTQNLVFSITANGIGCGVIPPSK